MAKLNAIDALENEGCTHYYLDFPKILIFIEGKFLERNVPCLESSMKYINLLQLEWCGEP